MRRTLVLLACLVIPTQLIAADGAISRRDGFLMLWQSLGRPALETRKASFSDLKEGEKGFKELIYAKSRNILNDEDAFFPDEKLRMQDALIWLFRSRNIADPDEVNPDTLPDLLTRYPIAHLKTDEQKMAPISQEDLLLLQQSLDKTLREEVHEVSLYAEKWHGQGTAFGESFDMHALTAAHRTFPHNTLVKVTNVENGKSVTVRINDRGPFVKGRDMDLSLAAFTTIAPRSKGVIDVTFQRLGDATMVSACETPLRREQTRLSRSQVLSSGVPHTLKLGETLTLKSAKGFVVRSVRYPDGTVTKVQDWITEGESFTLKPSIAGPYLFLIGSLDGRVRYMGMNAVECDD